jgi:DNA helicase-2/ATP-dependent DNA helicase PcrA
MASMLENLNEAQHTAVTSPSNVLQILAPPGSGKTKTLTSRVAYLLQHHHYKPWNVICLTFTIKSSREMRERLSKLLGNGIESRLILGTFHSICRRYLVTYGHLIGLKKDFGIADSSDSLSIIKRIVKRLGINVDPRKAHSRISSSKSKGMGYPELAQAEAKKNNVEQQEFESVFQAYQDQLAQSSLLDYDDLLLRCVDLLGLYPSCVSNVEVVLIDEFQDTNLVQFDLMRLFAAYNKRVTTVADPDQSIYGWRSAEIKNLKRMRRQYPDTLVIELETNYRSSGAILLAAHEVIEQDESRHPKALLPTHCPGTVPVLRRLPSAEIEASWIVSEIQRVHALTGDLFTFSDYAILLRSASLSRYVESSMGRAGIPYRMVGGQKFFDRVEVKILLDYLRVISQPYNNDALARVMNIPARGIGPMTAKGLLEEAEARKTSLWTLLREAAQGHKKPKTKLSKAAENGVGTLTSIILTSRTKVLDCSAQHSPEDLLRQIIKKLDFQSHLKRTQTDDYENRWANIEELIVQASEFPMLNSEGDFEEGDSLPPIAGLKQDKGSAAEEALSKFLANVALATELQRDDEDPEGNKSQSQVTISTIHAAKGLEWPVVFVPSTYEGCIPHSRAEDTDEERRLLYVAMTRAQALLYMSCPTKNSQREETTLSSFLSTKKVGQYITNQGPTIGSATVNDICQILGRDYPNQARIIEASKMLTSLHDDVWPLNGMEDVKSITSRRSKWDNNSGEHGAKRRRVEVEGSNARVGNQEATVLGNSYTLANVGVMTTMQNSSTFSYGGFTSATSQLNNDNQRRESAASRLQTSKVETMRGNSKPVNSAKAQESLMSFWVKGDETNRKSDKSVVVKAKEEHTIQETLVNHSQLNRYEVHGAPTPLTLSVPHETGRPTGRTPLSAIPQTLSAHRLPTISNNSRPYLLPRGDEPAKKQYSFLSSSPSDNEVLLEQAEKEVEEPSHGLAVDILEHESASHHTDIRPATTHHTTTMTHLHSAASIPRKTLGVRRSMNGWTARSNHKFAMPKIAALGPQKK